MQFNYVAYTLERGKIEGRVEAESEVEARREVIQQGYKPLRITRARRLPSREELFPAVFKVSAAEKIGFFRQMAVMLSSGGNLLRTLEMLESETRNRVLQGILNSIKRSLEEGGSFSSESITD